MPGVSFSASHGWLNHVAVMAPPLPSRTTALTIVLLPRSGRDRELTTWPEIATSPSTRPSRAIGTSSAALS